MNGNDIKENGDGDESSNLEKLKEDGEKDQMKRIFILLFIPGNRGANAGDTAKPFHRTLF